MSEKLTVERFYSEARADNRLFGLVCEHGHMTVPPRSSCRICGSRNLETRELSRFGVVISCSRVYAKSRDFPVEVPYDLALVQLDEGGRLLGVLSEEVSGPRARVKVRFETVPVGSPWPRVFFDKVG